MHKKRGNSYSNNSKKKEKHMTAEMLREIFIPFLGTTLMVILDVVLG